MGILKKEKNIRFLRFYVKTRSRAEIPNLQKRAKTFPESRRR